MFSPVKRTPVQFLAGERASVWWKTGYLKKPLEFDVRPWRNEASTSCLWDVRRGAADSTGGGENRRRDVNCVHAVVGSDVGFKYSLSLR